MRALMLAVAVGLAGCPRKQAQTAPPVEDTTVYLATPYTAEQIREAMPTGTHIQLASSTPQGQRKFDWIVQTTDSEGVTIRYHELSGAGQILEGPTESWSAWTELQNHARFPEEGATRSRVTFPSALGPLTGWKYEVHTTSTDDVPQLRTFWFADALPGPPVLLTVTEDGLEVMRMEQTIRERP